MAQLPFPVRDISQLANDLQAIQTIYYRTVKNPWPRSWSSLPSDHIFRSNLCNSKVKAGQLSARSEFRTLQKQIEFQFDPGLLEFGKQNAGNSYDSVDLVWNSGANVCRCPRMRFLGFFWPNISTLKVDKSFLTRKLVLTLTKCFFHPLKVGNWSSCILRKTRYHLMSFHLKKTSNSASGHACNASEDGDRPKQARAERHTSWHWLITFRCPNALITTLPWIQPGSLAAPG